MSVFLLGSLALFRWKPLTHTATDHPDADVQLEGKQDDPR